MSVAGYCERKGGEQRQRPCTSDSRQRPYTPYRFFRCCFDSLGSGKVDKGLVEGRRSACGREGEYRLPRRICRTQLGATAALLLLLHMPGSVARGVSPTEAKDVSLLAQSAAAASVSKERVQWAEGAHGANDIDKSPSLTSVIYSKDGTWTLPVKAIAAGAACKPHCTGVCMEHCQFNANPATGLVQDPAACSADCKDMCKRGCHRENAKVGGKQHDESLADAVAKEAEINAETANPEEGVGAGSQGEGNDGSEESNAKTDGVGINDSSKRDEIPLKDCIPVCLAECFPQCERASRKDPHICKGDCNSYCVRDCKISQGTGGDVDAPALPEDKEGGGLFEYMSVDDAVLPHQSPKMDSRELGPNECEPHCNSECVTECQRKYHTPKKCPTECHKDCYNYCKPLYGKLNNVGDKLVQEAEEKSAHKMPMYNEDIERQHTHEMLASSKDEDGGSVGSGQQDVADTLASTAELGTGSTEARLSKKPPSLSATSRYFGGNPAVQWLASSLCVLAVVGVLGVVLQQRRLGSGRVYVSVSASKV